MSTRSCCKKSPGKTRRTGGKLTGFFSGVVPGILLLLVPKCPICLAAYISLGTGIGLSFATAKMVRTLLIVCCIISLTAYGIFFVVKRIRGHKGI